MNWVKAKLKSKVLKYTLGYFSFNLLIYMYLLFIILSVGVGINLKAEDVSSDTYINALKEKQNLINSKLNTFVELPIYYGIDNIKRKDSFARSEMIYVNSEDISCFSMEGDKNSNFRAKSYECMGYTQSEIKLFELYESAANNYLRQNDVGEVTDSKTINYPVKRPFYQTADYQSNDSVHLGSHDGIDLVPETDINVYASANGRIISTETSCKAFGGYLGNYCGYGYGNHVVEEVVFKNTTIHIVYGHMSGVNVLEGQSVSQGEKIGVMGNSGNTTGQHVHFQIEIMDGNGEFYPINPELVVSE